MTNKIPKDIFSPELDEIYRIAKGKNIQISGWIPVYNKIRFIIAHTYGGDASLIYITLLSHHNTQTDETSVSIETLSFETGYGVKKIRRIITKLHEAGYIIVNTGKNHKANEYWFPYEPFFAPDNTDMLNAKKRIGNTKQFAKPKTSETVEEEKERLAWASEYDADDIF